MCETNSFQVNRETPFRRYFEPAALFILGLSLQLSILPYWKTLPLSGDELHYWNWAREVATGRLLHNYLHPPLWTYLLSVGALFSDNPLCGRMITVVVSSISIVIVYLLGKDLFGRKVGLIAGIVCSIYPNLVGFSHYLWSEIFLACLILFAALLLFTPGRAANKSCRIYFSFLVLGFALLVKEFAIVAFVAALYSLTVTCLKDKWKMIRRCALIFIAPAIIYSSLASIWAQRPVILADAFIYNSNEADAGKIVWKSSTKENARVFAARVLDIRKMPKRLINQVANLWTITSFPIFRLIASNEGYRNLPHARAIAYIAAFMYVLVIGSGLAGMCFARSDPFLKYAVGSLVIINLMGLMFLMCSRFRIPFLHIFILYGAAAWGDFRNMANRRSLLRGLLLLFLLMVFLIVLVEKHSCFGLWG